MEMDINLLKRILELYTQILSFLAILLNFFLSIFFKEK